MLTNDRCRVWLPAASSFPSLILPTPRPAVPHCLFSVPPLQSFPLHPKWSPPPSLPLLSAWPTSLPTEALLQTQHTCRIHKPPAHSLCLYEEVCEQIPCHGCRHYHMVSFALTYCSGFQIMFLMPRWSGARGINTDLGDMRPAPILDHTSQITGFPRPHPS